MCSHLGQFGGQLRTRGERVSGLASAEIDLGAGVAIGQYRLADGSAVCGLATADASGKPAAHTVADFVQIDDVGAVQYGEMHDKTSGAMQFAQQRLGCAHHAVLVDREGSQFDQAHAEFVIVTAATQPAHLHQPLQHPVCRGARQAGASHDLRESEPSRPVERVEDKGDAVDDGAGGGGVNAGWHGSSRQ